MKSKRKINKSMEIEINEYVDINISLEIDEIVDFIQQCDQEEKSLILTNLGRFSIFDDIKINTLEDEFKVKALIKLYNKYTLTHLENLI
jgi:hypothetical protein